MELNSAGQPVASEAHSSLPRLSINVGIFLCLLATLLRPLVTGSLPYEYNNVFIHTFWLFGTGFVLGGMLAQDCFVYRRIGLSWVWLGFVLVNGASYFYSANVHVTGQWLQTLFYPSLFLLLALTCFDREQWMINLSVFFSACFVAVAYGFYQFYVSLAMTRLSVESNEALMNSFGTMKGLFQSRLNTEDAFSTLITSNAFGILIVVMMPFVFEAFLLAWRQEKRKSVSSAVLLIILCWALSLTNSKGSVLCLCAVFGLYALCWIGQRVAPKFRVLVVTGIVIGAGCLTFWIVSHHGTSNVSMMVRWQYWCAGWAMWLDHPWIGVGAGTFGDWYASYKTLNGWEVQKTHNNYLQVLCETGVLGLLFMLWFFIKPLFIARAKETETEEGTATTVHRKKNRLALFAGVAGLAYALVMNLPGFNGEHYVKGMMGLLLVYGLAALYFEKNLKPMPNALWMRACKMALAGWLLHSFIDFDFYIPTLLLMGGCFVVSLVIFGGAGEKVSSNLGRLRMPALLVVFMSVVGIYQFVVADELVLCHALSDLQMDYEEGKAEEKLKRVEAVAHLIPNSEWLYRKMVTYRHALYREGHTGFTGKPVRERIVHDIQESIRCNPLKSGNYAQLAQYLFLFEGDRALDRIVGLYEQAIGYYPYKPQYRLELAQFHMRAKQPQRALVQLRQAIEINERITDIRTQLSPESLAALRQLQQTLDPDHK